jgi:hypothetical protein
MSKDHFKFHTEKVSIPVSLIDYAYANDFIKPLGIFVFLKMASSGKIHEDDAAWKEIYSCMGIKTKRTINKHVQSLIDAGWLVYNKNSGYYFIKAFERLRSILKISHRRAVKLQTKDLTTFKAFAAATLISANIKRQQYVALVKTTKRKRFAFQKEDEANTNLNRYMPTNYFGLSNSKIGSILNCQQTHGFRLKSEAVKAGYITSKQRFKLLLVLPKADFNLSKGLSYSCSLNTNRIKLKAFNNKIEVYYQLHNEVDTFMVFVNRKRVSKQQVAFPCPSFSPCR